MGLLDHMATLFLAFKRASIMFSIVAAHISFPPTVQEGCLFFVPSPAFVNCRLFNDGHSDWCEVISRNSDCIPLIIHSIEHLFICLLVICMSSLGEMPIFFNWSV